MRIALKISSRFGKIYEFKTSDRSIDGSKVRKFPLFRRFKLICQLQLVSCYCIIESELSYVMIFLGFNTPLHVYVWALFVLKWPSAAWRMGKLGLNIMCQF